MLQKEISELCRFAVQLDSAKIEVAVKDGAAAPAAGVGRLEEVVGYSGFLLQLWCDCDADLIPTREERRVGRETLLGVSLLD